MSAVPRWPGVAGALAAAAGVALSAYAAHAAAGEAQRWLYTAAAIALVHGVALVNYRPSSPRLGVIAASVMTLGLVLFCGSLLGAHAFGWPTRLAPAGGSLLIASWLVVAIERARG